MKLLIAIIPLLILALLLCSCRSVPTWSRATPKQREDGFFTADESYYQSSEFHHGIEESADRVKALREEVIKSKL